TSVVHARKSRRRRTSLLRIEPLERRCVPATLTVNTTADVPAGTDLTHLSLREAILASELTYTPVGAQTAQVSGSLGTHNDTIVFDPSIAPTPTPIDLLIVGDTSAGSSAFVIPNGETLAIKGLTIPGS